MALGPTSRRDIRTAEAHLDSSIMSSDASTHQLNVDLNREEVEFLEYRYTKAGWEVDIKPCQMGPNESGFTFTIRRK